MRPDSLIFRTYLFRGALLWAVTRLTVSFFLFLASATVIRLSVVAAAAVILLVVGLGWIATWRSRELTLLGNLALSPLLITSCYAAPAVCGEIVLRAASSVFA
ncbi:MAG: hypothetical protein ACREMS_09715 [Gemmatimonadaceae bacterium]